jgi:hypothetical protein
MLLSGSVASRQTWEGNYKVRVCLRVGLGYCLICYRSHDTIRLIGEGEPHSTILVVTGLIITEILNVRCLVVNTLFPWPAAACCALSADLAC